MTRATTTTPATSTTREAGCPDCTDGLGKAAAVATGSFRDRIRSKPGLAQAWRVGVFLAGLVFIALGVALAVLPGPLTIPPVLVGLWIWSTEFAWAKRLFNSFQRKARDAWCTPDATRSARRSSRSAESGWRAQRSGPSATSI